jgi:hypothetical protein
MKVAGVLALGLAAVVALSAFMGWLVMLLWNVVVPGLFNGPEISFGVAWAMMVLFNILTGAIRGSTD